MTIVALNDDSFSATEPASAPAAEVVFLGSQFNFSCSLITITSQELGHISSAVIHSFAEFQAMIATAPMMPSVVVLDEPMMRGLSQDERDHLLGLPDVALGLAFCNEAYAKGCYQDSAMRQRAISIFPLDIRLDIWLPIIKLIAHGGNYVCPEVISTKQAEVPSLDECGLTQRQLDVLRLVADGQSNKRIAAMLDLSIHTVKLHLHNANLRLGARNRTEAAMRFRALHS